MGPAEGYTSLAQHDFYAIALGWWHIYFSILSLVMLNTNYRKPEMKCTILICFLAKITGVKLSSDFGGQGIKQMALFYCAPFRINEGRLYSTVGQPLERHQ